MRYLFYVHGYGLNKEFWQEGKTEKEAHNLVWDKLSDEQKNNVSYIECLDEFD